MPNVDELRATEDKRIQDLAGELDRQDVEIGRLKSVLDARDAQVATLTETLQSVLNSPGWKMLSMVGPMRERLIPTGSRRHHAWQQLFAGFGVVAREGVRGALLRLRRPNAVKQGVHGDTNGLQPLPPGEHSYVHARIAVISILAPGIAAVDRSKLMHWRNTQTLADVAVYQWDTTANSLTRLDLPGDVTPARTYADVVSQLGAKYMCAASDDLLGMPATYLESNLLALECYGAGVTINVLGNSTWVDDYVNCGHLPGDAAHPLFRQVANCENVRVQFPDGAGRSFGMVVMPGVPARVIHHESRMRDRRAGFLFDYEALAHARMNSDIRLLEAARPADANALVRLLPSAVARTVSVSSTDRPTVVVFMPFLAVGGAEKIHLDLIRALRDEIRFVVVTSMRTDSTQGTTADEFRALTPYVYTAADYLGQDAQVDFVMDVLARFGARTLYIANGVPWIFDALPAIRRQFPSLRIVGQVYDHKSGWIQRYDRTLAGIFDANIGCNVRICAEYERRGVPREKSVLLEHPFRSAEFDPAGYDHRRIGELRHYFGIPDGRKVVTYIARMHAQKRPMDYIELARRFVSDDRIWFLMVGDGPLGADIDAQIQRSGLGNITRRSFYSPSRDVFAVSDVVVLPSEYEGMPLVLLEAMSMGKRVVVTDVGNNRDVVTQANGGVVVNKIGDINALREGVLAMLSASDDGAQIRDAVISRYDVAPISRRYLNVLLGVN